MLKRWKSGENKRLLKRKRQTESTTSEITSVKLPTWKSTKVGITQRSQQPKQKAFAAKKKKTRGERCKGGKKRTNSAENLRKGLWEKRRNKICQNLDEDTANPSTPTTWAVQKRNEALWKTPFSHFIQSMDKINSSKERHNKISQRNERIYNALELSRQTFQEELTMLKEPLKGQMTCIICI